MSLTGWNTWDTYSLTSIVYAQTGLRLRAGILYKSTGECRRDILLPDMPPGPDLVGPRTADGSYIEWRVQQEDSRILLEFAAKGESFVWRISPEVWSDDLRLVIDVSSAWGDEVYVRRTGDTWTADGFEIRPLTEVSEDSTEDSIVFDLTNEPAVLAVDSRPCPVITSREAAVILSSARSQCVKNELQSDGYLRSAAQGLSRGTFWNTIWEPERNRPLPTFSRKWNVSFGGFVDAPADNFAQAASTGILEEGLAYLNIEEMLTEANSEGMLPNIGAANGTSIDRSEPPNGSHSALKLYKNYADRSFLERIYPGLVRWNRWWYSHREGNGDGLFEWGAEPITDPSNRYYGVPGKRRAMWELCADNSALYDDVEYNEETHTLEMADVGLNAYLALDAWSLREIAAILGRGDEVEEFGRKYHDLEEKVNTELWNEDEGIYLNKRWDGRWGVGYEPQMFFTLTAGIVPRDRAETMIRRYLLNEDRFWGEFPLPSLSRDHPAFPENTYYRGRIWGEQVHLVVEGLHRYQMDEIAWELTRRLLRMYLREWEEHSHSHENYNSVTGVGDDVRNATCDYAALGGIMAFAAIQQLVDVEAWGALRFGNLASEYARVSNVLIGGSRWDVEVGEGLKVRRDGRMMIESDVPAIVRGLTSPALPSSRLELEVKTAGSGRLVLFDVPKEVELSVNGQGHVEMRNGRTVALKLVP